MGLGTDFKYSLSTSPPGWEVESLADGSPVPLIFGGEIAEDMATLGCGEPIPGEPSMRQLTGTVVIQHNRSQYPYNRWTTFHFYWKRPDLKLSYSLRIYGQPPDPEGAFLKACTIDFTTNPDPEIPTPTPGAPYHLVEIRGGRTTADLEGVTYFTVQTYPTQ
jgi:hypothetical protein